MFQLQVLENEIFKFEENICDFEEDLNGGSNIPEDVRDTILTVIGMAKLLMAQKLTQFRELCYKNIVSQGWERSVWWNNKPGAGGRIEIPRSFDKLSTESSWLNWRWLTRKCHCNIQFGSSGLNVIFFPWQIYAWHGTLKFSLQKKICNIGLIFASTNKSVVGQFISAALKYWLPAGWKCLINYKYSRTSPATRIPSCPPARTWPGSGTWSASRWSRYTRGSRGSATSGEPTGLWR